MICRTILNETSYFGKGAIKEIANEVINRGLKKVMLVTDKDLLKFKVATKVCDILDEAKIDYEIYDKIKGVISSYLGIYRSVTHKLWRGSEWRFLF